MLGEPGRQLAVLGSPIAHSRSPQIHAAAYRALGLDWAYGRHEIVAAELAGFLAGLGDDWLGLSLTMPLKGEACRLAASLDRVAERSGVVNTLRRDTATGMWHGWNTDVRGLERAIRDLRSRQGRADPPRRVTVLGAGATAVSALLAAERLGAEHIELLARRPERAEALLARIPQPGLSRSAGDLGRLATPGRDETRDLVISTLPGTAGAELSVAASLRERSPLFDVAYDPWPSALARGWSEAGGVAGSGVDMLVWQALAQIRIFVFGDPERALPDEDAVLGAMRAAGMEE